MADEQSRILSLGWQIMSYYQHTPALPDQSFVSTNQRQRKRGALADWLQ
jgi:hypothetical protein